MALVLEIIRNTQKKTNKIALSSNDNKRIQDDNVSNTYPYGYFDNYKKVDTKNELDILREEAKALRNNCIKILRKEANIIQNTSKAIRKEIKILRKEANIIQNTSKTIRKEINDVIKEFHVIKEINIVKKEPHTKK